MEGNCVLPIIHKLKYLYKTRQIVMLRPLVTLSVLSSAILLTACQSMLGHIPIKSNTNNNSSNYKNSGYKSGDYGSVGYKNIGTDYNAQSSFAYNDWQWKYFSRLAKKTNNNSVNVNDITDNWQNQLLTTPNKAVEATGGNVWGYDYQANTIHPNNWGNISGSQQCATGLEQSPINIVKAVIPLPSVTRAYNLQFNYRPQSFSVLDNGHTLAFIVNDPQASSISVRGKTYNLIRIDYHAVSEHAIMNVHLPLELELVHANGDGSIVTVSVLVNIGEDNSQLAKMINYLPNQSHNKKLYATPRSANATGNTLLNNFNAGTLIPSRSFYAYDGSFTTPPCRENNQWLVATQALTASPEQIFKFQSLYKGNNRPLQAQGSRTVYLIR